MSITKLFAITSPMSARATTVEAPNLQGSSLSPATKTKASTLRVRVTLKASSRAAPSQLITTQGLPVAAAEHFSVPGHQDESFDFARLPVAAAEHFSVPGHQDESFDFASTCYTESIVPSCTLQLITTCWMPVSGAR
ncbi:hypothetical protein R3P38DRAFT_3214424 [Favolaschia claudopus]|uniref:Uncharacterized protein n=1 Tax=Favolaschia claudopus TaxID=2862362 RepID=A0AAW0ABH9_9AGAR